MFNIFMNSLRVRIQTGVRKVFVQLFYDRFRDKINEANVKVFYLDINEDQN